MNTLKESILDILYEDKRRQEKELKLLNNLINYHSSQSGFTDSINKLVKNLHKTGLEGWTTKHYILGY